MYNWTGVHEEVLLNDVICLCSHNNEKGGCFSSYFMIISLYCMRPVTQFPPGPPHFMYEALSTIIQDL